MLTLGPLWRGWIEEQFDDAHMTGKSLLCAPVIPCRKGSFSKWCQKSPFVVVNWFLLQDISLFYWYFGCIWWYLVISNVFAPNMKAGKGRRYLQPPSSESHHLQNERSVVTMTVMMMVKTKLLKDLLNHCFSREMSLRGPILSLDFNHHQFFSKRLFTLVGCSQLLYVPYALHSTGKLDVLLALVSN